MGAHVDQAEFSIDDYVDEDPVCFDMAVTGSSKITPQGDLCIAL